METDNAWLLDVKLGGRTLQQLGGLADHCQGAGITMQPWDNTNTVESIDPSQFSLKPCDAFIFNQAVLHDTKFKRGRPPKDVALSCPAGKSAELMAKRLGTTRVKIEMVRAVLAYGDDRTKEALSIGKITLHSAYRQTNKHKTRHGHEYR